jgi:hypothetical protein
MFVCAHYSIAARNGASARCGTAHAAAANEFAAVCGDCPARKRAGYYYEARLRGLHEGGITSQIELPVFIRNVHQQADPS